MRLRIAGWAFLLVAAPGLAGAQSIVIDDFNDGAISLALSSAPGTVADYVDGTNIIQTERNVRVSGSSVAGGDLTLSVDSGNSNALTFVRPAGSNGTIEFWWDGNNNTTSFQVNGLGGADLTANGQNGFRIQVVSSSSPSLTLAFYVYSSGGNTSRAEFTLPVTGGAVDVPYASFSVFGGSGADFSSVGAMIIGTTSPSDAAWTATIDDIRTIQTSLLFSDGFETGDTIRWSLAAP